MKVKSSHEKKNGADTQRHQINNEFNNFSSQKNESICYGARCMRHFYQFDFIFELVVGQFVIGNKNL